MDRKGKYEGRGGGGGWRQHKNKNAGRPWAFFGGNFAKDLAGRLALCGKRFGGKNIGGNVR